MVGNRIDKIIDVFEIFCYLPGENILLAILILAAIEFVSFSYLLSTIILIITIVLAGIRVALCSCKEADF